ncbi:MAG: hypothetical protein O8C61_09855 [Candidatus Methanoperedens sp.]|nr:hypothetical protein [Candidatus Methanoperedens sp.]
MENLSLISLKAGSSIVLGLIGLYLVIRIWTKWQIMDLDIIKARVFLNRKFLIKNWLYTFLSGASLVTHQFLDLSVSMNYLENTLLIETLSSFSVLMALGFLVLLAFEWYVMLLQKK